MKKIAYFSLILLLGIVSISAKKEKLEKGLYAKIITSKGEILLQLEFQKVPLTVANFVALAEGDMPNEVRPIGEPFFDGNRFHRVIKDFMIQGGDPVNSGGKNSNAGYSFKDEFHPELLHDGAGVLSMANAGPATNSTQFFITHKETPWLNNKHSVFGRVVKGQDVVNAIVQGDEIKKVQIIRVGKEAKKFDAMKTFNELK